MFDEIIQSVVVEKPMKEVEVNFDRVFDIMWMPGMDGDKSLVKKLNDLAKKWIVNKVVYIPDGTFMRANIYAKRRN